MGEGVKGREPGRRTYDSSGRRLRALEARRSVVDAARGLVEERGFAATTIAEVARRAGVSPESVYKGFGTKAALLKEVFDITIAGDDAAVAVADRPAAQQLRAEPDVRIKLRLYAEDAATRTERSARVQLAIRNGAAAEPAVDELWQALQAERLTGMTTLARHLVDTGQVRSGMETDAVRDVLWTCNSIEIYDLFVLQRGWSRSAYTDWLTRTLIASIC